MIRIEELIMSESSMWSTLRPHLKGLDPIRIENRLEKGTPDVNLANGSWIELKWRRRKPKNPSAILKLDHEYSQEQRVWAIKRFQAGGKIFVLLKISNEWLLFTGLIAAEYLEKVSLNELRKVACGRWIKRINSEELKFLLRI